MIAWEPGDFAVLSLLWLWHIDGKGFADKNLAIVAGIVLL